MKKVFLTLLFVAIIILPVDAKTSEIRTYNYMETYFHDNNINIKTKTYKGWIRVLLSGTKRKQYHLNLSKKQINIYTHKLKILQNKKIIYKNNNI